MSASCMLLAALTLTSFVAQVRGEESLRASRQAPSQVLVFDAGSSGTRIHVFNFLPVLKDDLVPRIDLSVREQQTKKIKPGLSSFADKGDYAGAEQSITQLLEFASKWVPAERRATTPVLLKATAGLRAVKPPEKAEATLQRVRDTLTHSGYLFQPNWADIIKGKEEAGLAWVAANYLQGVLAKKPDGVSSLGVVEMGGGSTQVTFEVNPKDAYRLATDDTFTFNTLAGTAYQLYAHSYLGYGLDYAQASAKSSLPDSEVEDPCYQVGYVRPNQQDKQSRISGTGKSDACQQHIKERLFTSAHETAPGRYASEMIMRGNFLATENFFYVRNDLKLPMDGNLDVMKDAARTTCATPLNPSASEEAAMKAGNANSMKHKHCFALCFQVALLESLQVGSLPGVKVNIARNINGGDIDWAMGAALMHFIDTGMAKQADLQSMQDVSSLQLGFAICLLSVVALAGAVRYIVGPRCSKQVGSTVGAAVRATPIGNSGWIQVASKNPDEGD